MARVTSPTGPASESPPALTGRRAGAHGSYARAVLLVTGLGLLIRGLFLGLTPLWTDEAFMGVLLRRPLGTMIDVVHNDNHPPLQYLLDRLATLVRDSPDALRLPSVLAGTASVALAAALGRRLGGDRAGVTAGLLTAAMPLLVLWSRDARMYSLAICLVLAMALTLWRATETATRGRIAAYFVVTVFALYTHYLVALAVPAQLAAAWLFLRPSRSTMARVLAAATAAGITLVPWLLYAAPQFRHAGDPYWIVPLSPGQVPGVMLDLITRPGPMTVIIAAALIGIPVGALLGLMAYRGAPSPERQGFLYLLGCGGFALGALFVLSLKKPLLDERFTNLYSTELLPIAGAALAWTGRRWLVAAAVTLLFAVSAVQMTTLPTPDIPAVVGPLAGRVDPTRDVVAVNGPYHYFQVLYYGDRDVIAATRAVADRVPWYFGLAGFRPGDIRPGVPDPPGVLYLVTDPGQGLPRMPQDLHFRSRQCAYLTCVETWIH